MTDTDLNTVVEENITTWLVPKRSAKSAATGVTPDPLQPPVVPNAEYQVVSARPCPWPGGRQRSGTSCFCSAQVPPPMETDPIDATTPGVASLSCENGDRRRPCGQSAYSAPGVHNAKRDGLVTLTAGIAVGDHRYVLDDRGLGEGQPAARRLEVGS